MNSHTDVLMIYFVDSANGDIDKVGFVSLFVRRGAAEVRKQVSSAYLGDLSKSSSGINISAVAAALQNVSL